MECVAKVVSMLYPQQILSIQLNSCWILPVVGPATEVYTLGLGQLWDRVSGEHEIVFLTIPLTDGQHPLQYLSVGGQQDQVISIATSSHPPTSNMTTQPQLFRSGDQVIQGDTE